MSHSETENKPTKRKPRGRSFFASGLLVFFGLTYLARPDALQAIHWWPLALWTPVILLPWFSLRPWRWWKPILGTLAVWLGLLHFEGNLPFPLVMPKDSDVAVVVSLNCAGGSVEAAREAFEVGAGLVLLQEVASKKEFVAEGRKHGYTEVAWSFDDAIFARTPLSDSISKSDFVAATWVRGEEKTRVVSLRLRPPTFRLDLWNPDSWRAYAEDKRLRRERFAEIAREAGLGEVWLVGGDFNATNPRIVRDSFPKAEEALRTRGVTWFGTGTNDFPLAPVDQLWSSHGGWVQAWVRKTRNSDHRMVMAQIR